MKKNRFSKKNLSSRICPKVDSDYLRGTCESVVHIPLLWNNGNNHNFLFETCEFNIFCVPHLALMNAEISPANFSADPSYFD